MSEKLRVVALLFPQVTQLDLTGPVQLLARLPDTTIDLAWHRIEPVPTDAGFSIMPTTTLDSAPQADVLLVPGGPGAFDAMEDPTIVDFVRRQAAGAKYVTSVCTGAFVLGAAGLLAGRRATTHWGSHALLEMVGAIPEKSRVVRDGNIITAGGVTSGIDFALVVAAELFDDRTARSVQLHMEYDPHPPFDAGTPDSADADREQVEQTYAWAQRERGPRVAAVAAGLFPDEARTATT